MTLGKPSFALGVLLAALIPYTALMIVLLMPLDGRGAEERAFGQFVAVMIGFAGVPVFLMLAGIVFGLGQLVLQRLSMTGVWSYVLWGAISALSLLGMMLVLPPEQSLSGRLPAVLFVAVVGGLAGAGFWAGACPRTNA